MEEASDGSLRLTIIPADGQSAEIDCLGQLRAGQADMAKVSVAALAEMRSEWKALFVPYLFRDRDHYYDVMASEIMQELYGLTAGDGFIGLTWLECGARSFYTADKAIRTPADLQGLRICAADRPMAADLVTALGGVPVSMDYGAISAAMTRWLPWSTMRHNPVLLL